jgi:hypothetical protein
LQDLRKLASRKHRRQKAARLTLPYQTPKLCRGPLVPAAGASLSQCGGAKNMPMVLLVYGVAAIPVLWGICPESAKYCLFIGRNKADWEEIVRCGNVVWDGWMPEL